MIRVMIVIAVGLLQLGAPAHADPRLRTLTYDADRVIPLTGHFGYQIAVEFPVADRIESVAIGDALTWQVTPNKRGNMLFVKPIDEGEPTNMTVMTSRRLYTFELTARRRTPETPASALLYHLRIEDPAPTPAGLKPDDLRDVAAPPPRPLNMSYSYVGARRNLPSRVFDDGVSTTFEWPDGVETPAIFYRRGDGLESMVNFTQRGDAIIVHQIAAEFILRNGKDVTRVFNDAHKEIDRGPDAPRPREKKKGGLFGLFRE